MKVLFLPKMPQTYTTGKGNRPIINLGDTRAISIAPDSAHSKIMVPELNSQNTFAVLSAEQTLGNKTLMNPVIASLKQSSSGGTINMPTVASGSSATLATTTDIPSNMVSTDGAQTITGVKTLTTPIISSLKQSSTGGTINMPEVASGETATLATTADITTATGNVVTTDTTQTISNIKTFTATQIFDHGVRIIMNKNTTDQIRLLAEHGDDCIGIERTYVDDDNNTQTSRLNTPMTTASTDYIATTELAQTLNNKTLTSPVLTDGTHTISMPAAASLTENTTIATALDIAALQSSVPANTDFQRVCAILGNLLTYLRNWIDVGNLDMNDIITEVDDTNYLGLISNGVDEEEAP